MSDSNGLSGGDRVSFLVQFFGIHEITESFENHSLLVSQLFKDKIDEVDRSTSIQCIFVFQDVKSLVGYGDIVRKDDPKDDAGQEPFEIEFKWTKLVMLPYNDISTQDTDYIVSAIGDDQDANWELKEITENQRLAIVDAIDRSAWETTESMISRYNIITNPLGAEPEPVETQTATEEPQLDAPHPEESADLHREGHADRKRERSRERSSRDRSGSRSRHSSRGALESATPQEAPKRSRIPFDVTKMSYDQYCAKHYSYAIDMYRAEKLAQYNAAQTARAMALGMPMGLPLHMMNQASMGMQSVYGMNSGGGYGAPVAPAGIAPGYGQPVGMGQGMNAGYGMGGMGGMGGGGMGGMGDMGRPQMPMTMAGGFYGQQGQTGYGAPVQSAPAPQSST